MSLFDFINKAQASVDQLQKKAEELQAKANQFANGLGMSTPIPDDVDLDDAPVAISNRYTCPIVIGNPLDDVCGEATYIFRWIFPHFTRSVRLSPHSAFHR